MIPETILASSSINDTFIQDTLLKGAAFMGNSGIFLEAHANDSVFSAYDEDFSTITDYKGATVIDPEKGFHENITVLDFASLYPSILIAYNLCPSTWISQKKMEAMGIKAGDPRLLEVKITETRSWFFWRGDKGVLPRRCERLLAERAKYRKMGKAYAEKGMMKESNNMEARQKACKVNANSLYGLNGAASTNPYACLPGSEAITALSRDGLVSAKEIIEKAFREMLAEAKEKMQKPLPETRVVYGDTDSLFIQFNLPFDECFAAGVKAAKLVSATLPPPMELAFEKVFSSIFFFAKKKYCGMLHSSLEAKPKLDSKGLSTVRRDIPPWVRETYQGCLDTILVKKDIPGSIVALKEAIRTCAEGKTPFQKFIVSKSMKSEYKNENVLQVIIREKMKKRNPGSEPKSGDRVPYVIVFDKKVKKDAPLFQRVEDAGYAIEKGLPIDAIYYIDALKTSLNDLYGAVSVDVHNEVKGILDWGIGIAHRRLRGIRDISTFFGIQSDVLGVKPEKSEPKKWVDKQRPLKKAAGRGGGGGGKDCKSIKDFFNKKE